VLKICGVPYHLPNSNEKAEIVISDQLGAEFNRFEVNDRGYSQLSE